MPGVGKPAGRCRCLYADLPRIALTTQTFQSRPVVANTAGSKSLEIRSIETRTSWVVASISLLLLGLSFGGPWITAVGLKQIASDMGGGRSVPSFATSLAWFGTAAGGILMGRIANRYSIRWTVMFGSAMIAIGLLISTLGASWQLWLGHGLFMGFLGNAGLNAPLYVYVSRWFDRRRGSALALISSGGYLAGFVWPTIFERAIAHFGWRWTMIGFAAFQLAIILPLAVAFLHRPPEVPAGTADGTAAAGKRLALGWNANLVFAMLAFASFLCCVTMAMPQQHLVAFCSDLGISATVGAAMLSVLLGMGFFSRQAWGWVSDRIGGLLTTLISSTLQCAAMVGFLFAQETTGLFTVSTVFGIGFSALIPAYVLTLREFYPVSEAHWRVPTLMFLSGSGMAVGGWLAGYLYDMHGYYTPAFATGVAFNIANMALLFMLVVRQRSYAYLR
jgi:MFS family permease